jgi:hypothetical protein
VLAADAPLLAAAHPAGPASFWYQGPEGEDCIYVPDASPACFVIVSGGSASSPTAPEPAAVAAGLAAELDLSLGQIDASPAAVHAGLTGAASWFWLPAAPTATTLTLSLEGERYMLLASPGAVSWSFGDGSGLQGGAGVPYAAGAIPAGAVTHVYGTRCLPGDSGSGSDVPTGCGPAGYTVSATVSWTVSYRATGPVAASGQLPTRTTQATLAYPVSEVRAFLVGGEA